MSEQERADELADALDKLLAGQPQNSGDPLMDVARQLAASQHEPGFGAKIRLKNSFDISGYSPKLQVILKAMKKYGLILADIGSNMYISGAPDERWDNDDLHQLGNIKASSFEVVKFNS